ncbi:MAG: AAA domain-containing protein [Culicoidibacterales bacterium]
MGYPNNQDTASFTELADLLTIYKNRLVNLSSRNRSLRLGKLAQFRSFDMQQLEFFEICQAPELMKKIWKAKKNNIEFEIIPKINQVTNIIERKLETIISEWEEQQDESDENYEEERELKISQERMKLAKKADEIEKNIIKLAKNISEQVKETGINNLYIGQLFVRGKLSDGTKISAPLLLFPAELTRSQARAWNLNVETTPVFNKVLVLALQFGHNVEIDVNTFEQAFDWEVWKTKSWQEFTDFFSEYNLELVAPIQEFTAFKQQTVAEFDREFTQLRTLELHHQVVLGDFPIANAIYENYEEMLEQQLITPEVSGLLSSTAEYQQQNQLRQVKINEENQHFISQLDASQEKAVAAIHQNPSMVVYGPPGTGKSQMITNLIADMIAKKQRVLMVSQKKVAIDVIASRLGRINESYMTVTNTAKDKKDVYKKILQIIEENQNYALLNLKKQRKSIENNLANATKKINENLAKFEEINHFLHKQHDLGISLQQMYVQISCDHQSYQFRAEFEHIIEQYGKIFSDFNRLEQYLSCLFEENYLQDVYRMFELKENQFMSKIDSEKDASKLFELEALIQEFKQTLLEPDKNEEFKSQDIDSKTLQWQLQHFINFMKYNRQADTQNKIASLSQNPNQLQVFMDDISWVCTQSTLEKVEVAVQKSDYPQLLAVLDEIEIALESREELETLQIKMLDLNSEERELLYQQVKKDTQTRAELLFTSLIELTLMKRSKEIEANNRKALIFMKSFPQMQESIYQEMQKKSKEVVEYIKIISRETVKEIIENGNGKAVKTQVQKKRMLPSLRQLLCTYTDELLGIIPCWLMTPETVADILPLNSHLFDVVIFDEASQILVETAIPTIYRGKKIVIVGDDKQLPPSDLFMKRGEDDEEEDELADAVTQEKSLLDIAKIQYPDVRLNYHYRAERSELIQFSNAAYYNGKLDVSPNVSNSGKKRAIQRFKVENAQFANNMNEAEANYIVKLVEIIFEKRANDETIGIIVFNAKQKDLVEDRLEAFAQKNAAFQRAYVKELSRFENGEDMSMFIKNIENVQGDERDIIILGTTYGPNQNGVVQARFGTLTNQGGENRLNVAISRAKKKVFVVTSFEPEQLNVQNSQNAGPKLFRKYLEYVRAIDEQAFDQATAILDSVTENNTNSVRMYEQFTNGENVKVLIQQLEQKGYTVHEKVGTSKYGFDLAIYDGQIEQYLLGIELDETPYQVFTDTRERDVFNRRFLNSKGWQVLRIWSKDLTNDMESVIQQIETIISK